MFSKFVGKWVIAGIIATVLLTAVAKKAQVFSYVGTAWNQAFTEAENSVPIKFELERIRNEIASLDGDISNMTRPIAEYKACIEKLSKDINKEQEALDKNKKALLAIATDLESNSKFVTIGTHKLPADQVRKQLDRDTQLLQKSELRLNTQKQVLQAKEEALRATQDQMAKVISKKRDYEVRLAQLEADEETLKIAKIGSDINIDTSRSTQIEDSLTKIEHRQTVEKNHLELRKGPTLSLLNQETIKDAPVDLKAIRTYLAGEKTEKAEKVASDK